MIYSITHYLNKFLFKYLYKNYYLKDFKVNKRNTIIY